MVGVAQLVERRLVVVDVAGSKPVTHPYVRGPVSPLGDTGPRSFASSRSRGDENHRLFTARGRPAFVLVGLGEGVVCAVVGEADGFGTPFEV